MPDSGPDATVGATSGDNLRAFQKWLRRDMAARQFTRIKTKDLWRRGSSSAGWLVIDRQTSKRRVGTSSYFTINVAAWPRGAWEGQLAISFARHLFPDEPNTTDAPLSSRPGDFENVQADWVIGGRVPTTTFGLSGSWWEVGPGSDFDLQRLESKVSDFLEVVEGAAPQLLEPERAISVLAQRPNFRSLHYAAAIMDANGLLGDDFQRIVVRLSDMWILKPRPATFRPVLIDWRRKANLPDIALPDPPVTLV